MDKTKQIQFITRKTNMSCGHRVMDHTMKCFSLHGHEYLVELTFSFSQTDRIGYALDFSEIKRVFVQFLQDHMDHGMILNPCDTKVIDTVKAIDSKYWLMSLNGDEYCNPSVENITKEVFISMSLLSYYLYPDNINDLNIHKVLIYETPNCFAECLRESISKEEVTNFTLKRHDLIRQYDEEKGVKNYDRNKE